MPATGEELVNFVIMGWIVLTTTSASVYMLTSVPLFLRAGGPWDAVFWVVCFCFFVACAVGFGRAIYRKVHEINVRVDKTEPLLASAP